MRKMRKLTKSLLLFLTVVLLVTTSLLSVVPIVEANVLYEHYNTGADDFWSCQGTTKLAQTFTPTVNHTIHQIVIRVAKHGLPETIMVGITATDANGTPYGNDLCNTTFNGNDLVECGGPPTYMCSMGIYEWKVISLGNGTNLVASTKYAIVISAPDAPMWNYFIWHADFSSPTYAGGQGMDWIGYWDDSYVLDFMFEERGPITNPVITINNATYVSRTTARLNSYLVDDGGEACDVRFQYSTVSGGGVGYENFSTYTEVDNGPCLSVTASRVTIANMDRDFDAYVYDDKGAGYFGDFTHQLTTFVDYSEIVSSSVMHAWMLGNTTEDGESCDGLHFLVLRSTNDIYYTLGEGTGFCAGNSDSYTDLIQGDQIRYTTIERNSTALTAKIYDDANRTNLLDTLNITVNATLFQYVYGVASHNSGSGDTDFDGYVANLSLGVNWTNTAWVNDTYITGDSPYVDITGLAVNTTYYFRVQARNAQGTVNGSELNFTTYPTISEPTNFTAYPDSTSISLTWTKGVNAAYTMIRGQTGDYPVSYTNGTQVYAGFMATALHSELTSGTTYYYRSWSYDGAGYSTNYTDILMTTTAYTEVTQDTPATPTTPSTWWGMPDYTGLSNIAGYGVINTIADNFEIPRNTFWMSLILLGIMCIGLFIYSVQHNATVAVVLTSVCIIVASIAGLLPMFMLIIVGIPIVGVFLVKRRI